jgi:uncharacterized protein
MGDMMEWMRLDVSGSDSCELSREGSGWKLVGNAEFEDSRGAARLAYAVSADSAWRTVRGAVRGMVGRNAVVLSIERGASGAWSLNGRTVPALQGLVDLDLGFTPATNLFPLRRLALRPGEAADAEAALLDEATWTLRRLRQRYERRDETGWWYESPDAGYAALLQVNADGFVVEYPGLWRGR